MKGQYKEIEISRITVTKNIRTNPDELAGLMESINQRGLLQPIGVYIENGEYMLAWGHRRLEACRKLDWVKIMAFVSTEKMTEEEFLVINTIENIHRKDVNTMELGSVCQQLLDMEYSVGEIAVKLSIPHGRVEQSLRIHQNLPEEIRETIGFGHSSSSKTGKVPTATADRIGMAKLKPEDKQKLYSIAKQRELTVQQISKILQMIRGGISIENAVKNIDSMLVKTVVLVVDKKEYEKININFSKYIESIVAGKESYNKKLLAK